MGASSRVLTICLTAVAIIGIGAVSVAETGTPPVRVPIVSGGDDDGQTAPATTVVERGDHLWKISTRRLNDILGRAPHGPEVGPYWREVVEANRHRIRSGDPDLIFPGETVELPPLPDGGQPEDPARGRAGGIP